jgi:glutathione S-transferase
MSIEIYAFPPSPRAFKVMAVANHLGLDWTLRMLDITKGEQNTPQYAALNPNMRMPTLKDGDYVRSASISPARSQRAGSCRRTSTRGST